MVIVIIGGLAVLHIMLVLRHNIIHDRKIHTLRRLDPVVVRLVPADAVLVVVTTVIPLTRLSLLDDAGSIESLAVLHTIHHAWGGVIDAPPGCPSGVLPEPSHGRLDLWNINEMKVKGMVLAHLTCWLPLEFSIVCDSRDTIPSYLGLIVLYAIISTICRASSILTLNHHFVSIYVTLPSHEK